MAHVLAKKLGLLQSSSLGLTSLSFANQKLADKAFELLKFIILSTDTSRRLFWVGWRGF